MDDVQFVLVGDGRYKEKILEEISKNDVSDMFIVVDRQPAERIPELLAACDAAFLSLVDDPLLVKTIPAKLQSYMACGMPIIAAVNGEATRIVQEADCGICCTIGDADELEKQIIELKNNPNLERLAQNSKTYFDANFEKQMLMDQVEKVLET